MESVKERTRWDSLDVLRGLAVVMVWMAHIHLNRFTGVELPPISGIEIGAGAGIEAGTDAVAYLRRIKQLGLHGIDLFFVLSGFLISSLLYGEYKKSGTFNAPRFWMRRGLKIWPSYYFTYGIYALAVSGMLLAEKGWDALALYWQYAWTNLVFLQNYIHFGTRWFASWSLAVEEQFYLGLPVVFLALSALFRGLRFIPWLCLCVCVGVLGLRICEVLWGGHDQDAIWRQTHFRLDALMFGVLLGYLYHFRSEWIERAKRFAPIYPYLFFASLAFPFFYPWGHGLTESIGLSVILLSSGGLVIYALTVPPDRVRANWIFNTLRFIGVYSYTIYVSQVLMLGITNHMQLKYADSLLEALAFSLVGLVGGSLLLGILVSHLVERPVLKLRNRLWPSPNAAL